MKFLKCFMAFKGRQYSTFSTFTENQNMTVSWVLRPGDFFDIVQMNYMGFHHKNESTYNTPAYRTGTYTKGDFFARGNDYNYAELLQNAYSQFVWRVKCEGDSSGNIWLDIRDATDPSTPMIRVDHCRQIDRIHALQSLIERANGGSWNAAEYGQPVPDYQYGNNNGIIRTPKLFYHKTDMFGTGNAIPTRTATVQALRVAPHLFSNAGTEMAQSLIDLEKRIGIFLGTVGCTVSAMYPNGGTLTSDYHCGTPHCNNNNTFTPWCGGIAATPLRSDVTAAYETWYGDEILSIVRGAGAYGSYGIYGSLVCDNQNNLSGWCIPQAREQMNSASSSTAGIDLLYNQAYKAGIFNTFGDYKYIMTSIMYIGGGNTYNAYNELTFPSSFHNNVDSKDIPATCIVDSYQTLEHHKKMRWGKVVNNAWDLQEDGTVTTLFLQGGQNNIFTLRDIQAGTPTSQTSASMGTYGSFGIIVSTYDTQTGAVNNAAQVFTPIHCLITPSIMSDFPALDIYGIRKRKTEQGSSFVTSYIQSESCFKYATRRNPYAGAFIDPTGDSPTLECVKIYKTINMSTPDVVESAEVIGGGGGGGILPPIG